MLRKWLRERICMCVCVKYVSVSRFSMSSVIVHFSEEVRSVCVGRGQAIYHVVESARLKEWWKGSEGEREIGLS